MESTSIRAWGHILAEQCGSLAGAHSVSGGDGRPERARGENKTKQYTGNLGWGRIFLMDGRENPWIPQVPSNAGNGSFSLRYIL